MDLLKSIFLSQMAQDREVEAGVLLLASSTVPSSPPPGRPPEPGAEPGGCEGVGNSSRFVLLINLTGRKSKHSEKWFSWEGGDKFLRTDQKGS